MSALANCISCLLPDEPRDIFFHPISPYALAKDGGYREYEGQHLLTSVERPLDTL